MPQRYKPGLVLARRPGEIAVIELPDSLGGHKVVISCVTIDRNQAKIGIDCPRAWNIYRGELRGEFLESAERPDH
jgi:sRNA-binding carbon storage regulator CsrA